MEPISLGNDIQVRPTKLYVAFSRTQLLVGTAFSEKGGIYI
jgi:hypothetical protein